MIGPAYVTHQAAYRSQRRVLKQSGREMAVEQCQLSVRTSAAASGKPIFCVRITAFGLGQGSSPTAFKGVNPAGPPSWFERAVSRAG
jgi:hypothetical protein